MLLNFPTLSQSNILLEACNKIENPNDRLACFREIHTPPTQTITTTDRQQIAIEVIKTEFAELQQIIRTGISYNTYSDSIIKPAKKLGALKLELNGTMPYMINSLEEAIVAYNDAKTVWHASIYDSMDGGILAGKILNPERAGLLGIVKKYNIPLETKLLTPHLPATAAILNIFDYAENKTKDAFATTTSPEKNIPLNEIIPTPFRPMPPVNDKCKDKYSLLYDPLICKDN